MQIRGAAVLGAALWLAAPAQAAVGLATYDDSTTYDAALALAPVTRLGSGNIQWGRPLNAGWEYGVLDGGQNVLTSGQWNWKTTNTFLPSSYPLLNYTAGGKLTMAFRANTTLLASAAQVGAGANTLTIRSQLTPTGALASVSMANLVLQYSNGKTVLLGDAFADQDGQFITLTDQALASGFKLTYSFGFFNRTDGKELDGLPTIEFILGYTDLGYDADIVPAIDSEFLGSSRFANAGAAFAQPLSPVPEPTSWALLVAGFGLAGGALRQRRLRTA